MRTGRAANNAHGSTVMPHVAGGGAGNRHRAGASACASGSHTGSETNITTERGWQDCGIGREGLEQRGTPRGYRHRSLDPATHLRTPHIVLVVYVQLAAAPRQRAVVQKARAAANAALAPRQRQPVARQQAPRQPRQQVSHGSYERLVADWRWLTE